MGIIYKMAAGELPSSSSSSSSVVHPVANYKVLPVSDDYAMSTTSSSSALTSISGILCPPSAIRAAGSSSSSNHHEKKGKKNLQQQVLNEQGSSSTDHNYNVGNKPNKTIAKMKELISRWSAAAAAAKQSQSQSHGEGATGKSMTPSYIVRKVAHFRNRGTLKAASGIRNSSNKIVGGGDCNHGDGIISNSPKISFKWDVGSCSTSSSVYSLSVMALPSSTCRNNNNHRRSTAATTTPAAYISNDDDQQIRPSSSSSTDNYRTSYGSCKKDIAVITEAISSSDQPTTATRFGNWITTDDDFVVLEL